MAAGRSSTHGACDLCMRTRTRVPSARLGAAEGTVLVSLDLEAAKLAGTL